jgi:hypothetical protein
LNYFFEFCENNTVPKKRTLNPVILSNGSSREMPFGEYAALGFTFNPVIRWINDAGPDFDAAQAIGGSPEISIPSGTKDDYFINFSVPVRAFGFWVINNNTAGVTPVFEAYGANGLIETVRLLLFGAHPN